MTFLDELADLCLDPVERALYRQDPASWLTAHHCGHLCGEDVSAALPVLRSWLPPTVASRLQLDGDGDHPAKPAPAPGESELGAAVRLLDHLLTRLD